MKKSTIISAGLKKSTFISDSDSVSWKSTNRILFAKCSQLSKQRTSEVSSNVAPLQSSWKSVNLIRRTLKQTLMIFITFFISFLTFPSLILYNDVPFIEAHDKGDDWT